MENNEEWVKQEGGSFWKPQTKGEQLVGTVVEIIDDPDKKFGRQHVIKNERGDKVRTPSHKVLQSLMEDAVVGTVVKIVYQGQQAATVRGNRPTEMYDVFFKKTPEQGAGGASPSPSKNEELGAFL